MGTTSEDRLKTGSGGAWTGPPQQMAACRSPCMAVPPCLPSSFPPLNLLQCDLQHIDAPCDSCVVLAFLLKRTEHDGPVTT